MMQVSSNCFRQLGVLFAVVSLLMSTGCYQRTVAPELQYDEAQVEQYDSQFKEIEW